MEKALFQSLLQQLNDETEKYYPKNKVNFVSLSNRIPIEEIPRDKGNKELAMFLYRTLNALVNKKIVTAGLDYIVETDSMPRNIENVPYYHGKKPLNKYQFVFGVILYLFALLLTVPTFIALKKYGMIATLYTIFFTKDLLYKPMNIIYNFHNIIWCECEIKAITLLHYLFPRNKFIKSGYCFNLVIRSEDTNEFLKKQFYVICSNVE